MILDGETNIVNLKIKQVSVNKAVIYLRVKAKLYKTLFQKNFHSVNDEENISYKNCCS